MEVDPGGVYNLSWLAGWVMKGLMSIAVTQALFHSLHRVDSPWQISISVVK